jgi:L-cysteate sulfo-lyase
MHLARFPRVHFAHLPTPLEPMGNLTRLLGGPSLFVKRDDCTGIATGGNKKRKLEFLIGDALRLGADTVITHGAVPVQPRPPGRGRRLPLRPALRGPARAPGSRARARVRGERQRPARPTPQGAAELRRRRHRYGRRLRPGRRDGAPARRPALPDPGRRLERRRRARLRQRALELLQQANERDLRIDCVVVGSGSTGTQAGLVCGLEGANSGIDVLGICVRRPQAPQEEAVHQTASATAEHLGIKARIDRARVIANGDYVGEGYGIPTAGTLEAIRIAAEQEGLLLDPVYTGKAMAGLIDLCRQSFFTKDQNVVFFLHTGGMAALFAYEADLLA